MHTLHGVSRHPGAAVALAVVIDVQGGLSGVPERVMRDGLKALKRQAPQDEWPEVIVVSDLVSVGSAVRLPGVRIAAIASQGDDEAALPLTVPCVAGVANLLRSVGDEEFVIVDGSEGVVYVDPDVQTIIRYQMALEPQTISRVFLESAHLPARTQDGRIVKVMALVSSVAEVELAVSTGADALIVRFAHLVQSETSTGRVDLPDSQVELLKMVLALAGGKPLRVVFAEPDEGLIDLADRFGGHGHVIFVDPSEEPQATGDAGVEKAVCAGADSVVVTADAAARTKELIRTLPAEDTQG